MKTIVSILAFTALLIASNLEAAVLFDGGTYDINQYAAASNINCGPDCQVAAAQFSLVPGKNTITDVHWWGNYYPSAFTDNFTINIYPFVSGNPSTTPVATFNIGDTATRTDTGDKYTYNNSAIYSYDVDVPATGLIAGDSYLLSIVYNMPVGVQQDWGWTLGGSTGIAWTFTENLSWHVTDPHQYLAFNLTGPDNSVPEPSTFLLLGAGLGGLAFIRRKVRK